MDFKTIVKKSYNDFEELRADFAWLVHNCMARYSSSNSKTAKDIVKAAKNMMKNVESEIKSLLLCQECYENSYRDPDNSFVMPCTKPHILVWVNWENAGYWPAKVMGFDEKNMVNVRFFGDHTNSCVPSSECLILSKNAPKHKEGSFSDSSYILKYNK